MSRKRRPGQEGMVLVEVLVALALVAVMAGAMAGYVGQLRRIAGLERETAALGELAAAAQLVQRSLTGARQLPLARAGSDNQLAFEGDATSLRFTAVTRSGFRALALREIGLATADLAGRRALVETVRLRRADSPRAETFLVADPVSSVRFEYLDADGTVLAAWRGPTLPAGVRVTLTRVLTSGRPLTVQTLARLR